MTRVPPFLSMTVTLGALVPAAAACTAPNRYELSVPPTADTRSFQGAAVGPIVVGTIKDTLDPSTPTILRTAIVEAIAKEKVFQDRSRSTDTDSLQVDCTISEFDKGSQGGRWLAGAFGAGKGFMNVDCDFTAAQRNERIASGTFTTEVKGGWFGGSINQEDMSKKIAKQIAKFLKKGK